MKSPPEIHWNRLIAEGAAIVVSILLAFWIDAWWDERKEQIEFDNNLLALEQEISRNLEDVQGVLTTIDESLSKLDNVFRVLAGSDSRELPENFVDDVSDAYYYRGPDMTSNAFDVIVSPANMRRIENLGLRASIVRTRESLTDVSEFYYTLLSEYNERQAPTLQQLFVLSDFSWYDSAAKPDSYDLLAQADLLRAVPKARFTVDVKPVRTKEFWNRLYSWRSLNLDYANSLLTAQRDLQNSLELLESEMALRR